MSWMVPIVACAALAASTGDGCRTNPAPLSPLNATPTVSRVSPDSASIGATVTLAGTGFADNGNAVRIGDGYLLDLRSADGTTMTFTLPTGLDLCPPHPSGPCPQGFVRLAAGEYELSVVTDAGASNAVRFIVREDQAAAALLSTDPR